MINHRVLPAMLLSIACWAGEAPGADPIAFINTSFEGASPLYWEVDPNGEVQVFFVYDQERDSPNRANGHWLFQVQATPGADVTLVLNNFDNIWNGKHGSPLSDRTPCYVSDDGRQWNALGAEKTDDDQLRVQLHMKGDSLYVSRLEPYVLSDLRKLKESIRNNPRVAISPIGQTVQGRPLEIIRVGNPDAAHRVLLRARSHPWEMGGSWVVEGVIRRLLRDDADARRYLDRYCVYVLPMANKDGVARGRTRFNLLGKDLNRNWDRPADPDLAPENRALEAWIEKMIDQDRPLTLAIDLHNDNDGKLHISRPNVALDRYLDRMKTFEHLLRRHTWFTEGSTGSGFHNPGTFGEGLLQRYNIDACILELNADWIAGVKEPPSAKRWEEFGGGLCEVFCGYFGEGTR